MLHFVRFTLLTFFVALTFHADVRVIADIPTQVDVRVSGRQFDPQITSAFVELYQEGAV